VIAVTIKQNKWQTLLYAAVTLIGVGILFLGAFFDMRKYPHDYSFVLDKAPIYWGVRVLCFAFLFIAAAEIFIFLNKFSQRSL
jgi:hypothetical protein